jgi:hypothetical protein
MAEIVDTPNGPISEGDAQASLFPPKKQKPFNGTLQSYHYSWLTAHPDRTRAWLKTRLREGFHVHHVDGDHGNDAPLNLVLIEGTDHLRLHGMQLLDGIKRWRTGSRPRARQRVKPRASAKREARSRTADADLARMEAALASITPTRPKLEFDPAAMHAARAALASGRAPRQAQEAVVDACRHLSWAHARRVVKRAMTSGAPDFT